jgi:membrane associated rhomboid family serine protease
VEAPRYCYRHPDRETGLSCSECGRPICYECMTPAAVGLRCPDHAGGRQPVVARVKQAAAAPGTRRRANPVTLGLIAVNVAVAVVEFALGKQTTFTNNWIFDHGALFASACCINGQYVGVAHGEWYRMLTSMFLHANFIHLALNMVSLYFVGTILEHVIGGWRFLLLYLAAGLAGSAGALVWSPNVPTVGASGAIFGILGALLVLERRGNIATGGQILGLIVLNLVITFAFSSYISVGGHVGGLIAGIVLMILMLSFRRSAVQSIASAAAVGALAVIVAYMKVRNYQ